MQLTKSRFFQVVASISFSAACLGAIVGMAFGLSMTGIVGCIASAGLLLLIAAFFVLGGNSHGFRMRYSEANLYGQSLQYPGADVLTREDYSRMADQQRRDTRRNAPLAALLATSGIATFAIAVIVAQTLAVAS